MTNEENTIIYYGFGMSLFMFIITYLTGTIQDARFSYLGFATFGVFLKLGKIVIKQELKNEKSN